MLRDPNKLFCFALALGALSGAAGPAYAAMPVPAVPPDCVNALRDLHAGSGERRFTSHYVFDGFFAYGEWAAGVARGQSLWDKRGPHWCKIPTGGELLDEPALERHGIPPWSARRLLAKMQNGVQLAPPIPSPTPQGVRHR